MQSKFEQLLDYLVNEEQDKANELFHEIVVEKSRQIYENLLEEEEAEDEDDKEVDESSEVDEDEAVEENFEEESVYEIGGDETDDLVSDVEADMGDEGSEEDDMGDMGDMGDEEVDMYDIKNDLEELKAEIEKLVAATPGADDGEEMDMGGDEESDEDDVLKEYVDKVATPSNTAEKSTSPVAGKNDMGGTAVKTGGSSPEAGGKVAAPKVEDMGNGNVPGGKMGIKNLSKVAGGHGAEKKGTGEGSADKSSVVGS